MAEAAGADFVGDTDLIEKLKKKIGLTSMF